MQDNFVDMMAFYDMQIAPLFLITIVAFLVTSLVLLQKMTKIFGEQEIPEKKTIRTTILIYCVVFVIRILSLVLIVSDKQFIYAHEYTGDYPVFELI